MKLASLVKTADVRASSGLVRRMTIANATIDHATGHLPSPGSERSDEEAPMRSDREKSDAAGFFEHAIDTRERSIAGTPGWSSFVRTTITAEALRGSKPVDDRSWSRACSSSFVRGCDMA
jgi:hypothetical protein